jgi:hypothetical protein
MAQGRTCGDDTSRAARACVRRRCSRLGRVAGGHEFSLLRALNSRQSDGQHGSLQLPWAHDLYHTAPGGASALAGPRLSAARSSRAFSAEAR